MSRLIALVMCLVFAVMIVPVRAQVTQGAYEFESASLGLTYTGTWTTVTLFGSNNMLAVTTSGVGSVSFTVKGKSLVIWRMMRPSGTTSTMTVCVDAACAVVSNETTSTINFMQEYTVALSGATQTVTISRTTGSIHLDNFMVLGDASSAYPTAVPTATILPSSTPASTTTPQPTPTPQPTATPLQYVWALDPARSYGSANGQITAFDYQASAADVYIAILLALLLFSVWGFFIFCVFVLVKYRVRK